MDKRQAIVRIAENEEEKILFARIYERILGAEQKNIPAATCFLSKREQLLAERLLKGTAIHFFGGYPEAERAVCCYIPDYYEPENWLTGEDAPICALRASFYEGDTLSHRDFLGALMGSGIKRETVGDILVREGACDFLVTREICPYVRENLLSAGRTKLHISDISLTELRAVESEMKEIRDTLATLRLDSVVASGFGLSRSKAAAYIEGGKTTLNHLPCEKPDKQIAQDDQISVRGLGKIVLSSVGGISKKGRIGVVIRRFV